MAKVLTIKNISKHFGGVCALDNVSIEVTEGCVCALMGENGAGKSTLGKIISGVIKADSGEINFKQQKLDLHTALDAQNAGISIIMQELDLFPNQTIGENIALANENFKECVKGIINYKKMYSKCGVWLEKVGLKVDPKKLLNTLSIGQIQLVAIARALSMDSRLIIMDEPTSSLTDEGVAVLFKLINDLKRHGITVIYVSHKMSEIFEISDEIIVMRDGKYVGSKITAETDTDEIISMMVGREIDSSIINKSHAKSDVAINIQKLSTSYVTDIDLTVHKGEVLGMAGLVGAGRSELGEALFGLDRIHSGKIITHDQEVKIDCPLDAIKAGIGYVPEDRKVQGLMMQQSVIDNLCTSIHDQITTHGIIDKRKSSRFYTKAKNDTKLKSYSGNIGINTLSGGNQQKVLLSRWLLVNPDIYFFDDPTRGIDVGAKQDIYNIIENLASQGKAIILVSSELPELIRCCDRIAVMSAGRIAGIVKKSETSQEEIMTLAMKYL